jgi:hypothetical protein
MRRARLAEAPRAQFPPFRHRVSDGAGPIDVKILG